MRLTALLLFITQLAFGQAYLLSGVGKNKLTALPAPQITEYYIDNAVTGTGNNQNNYVGTWPVLNGAKADAWDNTFAYTNAGTNDGNNANDPYVEVRGTGNKFEIIAERFPSHGIMAVSVDGGTETMVDQYSSVNTESVINGVPQVIHTISGLSEALHVIKIRNTGDKNTLSSNTYTVVDAVRVTTSSIPTPPAPTSANWYVATTGCTGACSDSNNGTSRLTAFATIGKAASVAQPGDKIAIYSGTYRETIAPLNSGTLTNRIIYQAAAGQTVIVSGLEAISNGAWSAYDLTGTKRIYRAAVSNGPMYTEKMTGFNTNNLQYNNTQLLSQQLFKDGAMQFQAMHPKPTSVENILERSSQRNRLDAGGNFGDTQLTDATLDDYGAGALDEGEIWIQGWFITRTRHISAHSGTTITYQSTGDGGDHAFSNFYKIFNKLELLTQAKEWHYDGTYFYFHQTGGTSPTGVEYKKRNWGFDLRNKSYITVEGINFIGCDPVMTNPSSLAIIIDNIRATYTSHHMLESDGGNGGYYCSPVQTGSKLLGDGSIIRNSEFNYASGTTLWLGSGTQAINNKFQNGNYIGFYNAFIKLAYNVTAGSSNVKILNNTFYRSGRAAIDLGGESFGVTHSNIEIGYNDFSGHGMLNVDFGAIYSARQTIFTGSRFHHNWFHDPLFDEDGLGQMRGIQVTGNYFDMASGPIQYDHNVHWNGVNGTSRTGAYSADFYTQSYAPDVGNRFQQGKSTLYNNIFATKTGGGQYSYVVYNNQASVKDIHRNGIYRSVIVQDWGINGAAPDIANSLQLVNGPPPTNTPDIENPQWVGGSLSNPAAYFQLSSGSLGRGRGTTLAGVNDGDTSPKEAGAYYYSQTAWQNPGYVAVTYTPTP